MRTPTSVALRRALFLLAPLVAIPQGGCGHSVAFQRAASAFADATSTGAQSFEPAFSAATSLCRKRAQLDFLQKRVQSSTWGTSPSWNDWYAQARINPSSKQSDTWKAHCERIEKVEEAYRNGLALLDAYAHALAELGTSGVYDGRDLRDMARSVALTADTYKANALLSKGLAALGDPATRLADFLLAERTAKQMRASIKQADPYIQALLSALGSYTKAAEGELRDAEARLADLTMTLEVRTGAYAREEHRIDPAHVIAFYQFARTEQAELAEARRAQAAWTRVVEHLAQAHEQLAKAADEKGERGMAALRKVLRDAADALRAASSMHAIVLDTSAPAATTP